MSKLNQPVLYKKWICFSELVKLVLNHCMCGVRFLLFPLYKVVIGDFCGVIVVWCFLCLVVPICTGRCIVLFWFIPDTPCVRIIHY